MDAPFRSVSGLWCALLSAPTCPLRSALISLSSVNDDTMRNAKAGAWWEDAAQRAMANNSAVYTGTTTLEQVCLVMGLLAVLYLMDTASRNTGDSQVHSCELILATSTAAMLFTSAHLLLQEHSGLHHASCIPAA